MSKYGNAYNNYKTQPVKVDVVDVNGDQVLSFTPEQMKALNMKSGDSIVWNKDDQSGEVSFTVNSTNTATTNETD